MHCCIARKAASETIDFRMSYESDWPCADCGKEAVGSEDELCPRCAAAQMAPCAECDQPAAHGDYLCVDHRREFEQTQGA